MTDQPSYTCPRCGRTSYHPTDAAEGYCGNCHDWTAEPPQIDAYQHTAVGDDTLESSRKTGSTP